MKKILPLILLFTFLNVGKGSAQDRFDAIRISQNFYEGTARFTSMGGAFAALGGDFTSLSINPAGIGVYRGMEFTMTPAVSYSKTSSTYYGVNEKTSDSRTRFGFSNMGIISPLFASGSSTGLVNLNIGLGYNKLSNFNSNASAHVSNISGGHSMINSFVKQANSIGYHWKDLDDNDPYRFTDFNTGDWAVIQAWKTVLLDVDSNNDYLYYPIEALGNHRKFSQTKSEGSLGEYVFSLGGNVSHKLYFGLTVGAQYVNYESGKYYKEEVLNLVDLSSFTYNQASRTSGVGVNVKAGLIYRPIPELRLAFAAHTPTFFDLTDEYSSSMSSYFINGDRFSNKSPINEYDYRINTPYKLILGAAYTLKSYGLISVDYELVDYSTMRMKEHIDFFGPNGFNAENQIIKHTLSAASNVRVGIEGNLPQGFALRAGYGFYGSPYKSSARKGSDYTLVRGNITAPNYSIGIGDYTTQTYSAGFGYRFNGGFIDFAYSLTNSKTKYILDSYAFRTMDEVTTKTHFNRFALTFGLKF